jgi:uncharacterized protein YndB with AHSA1/START domain
LWIDIFFIHFRVNKNGIQIPIEKMAQKVKNQKAKKNTKTAKSKVLVKTSAGKKAKPVSKPVKSVKNAVKAKITKIAKAVSVKKIAPKKVIKTPVKAKIVATIAQSRAKTEKIAPKASKPIVLTAKKAQKIAPVAVSVPDPAIRNLPTIKKPGAGQVQQRRTTAGGKQQKKVFRTELIFPNQLKETPLVKAKSNKAEPKGKFELEFLVKASPTLLFDFLSTPSGLSEWFADDVDIRNEEFTFHWDGQVQRAKLLAYKLDHLLRLRWFDKNEDFYFEFRIDHDDLTGDVTLIVTDFGENEDDMRTSKLLWGSQVGKLLKVLGAY